MLGENHLFFSTALMIRLFRRSTRLAMKVQPFLWSPQATAGRWILRSGPSVTPALVLYINSEATGASFPYIQHSHPRSWSRAWLPNATACCRQHVSSGCLSAPPRSTALSSQHIPEVRNAAGLVLGMLVLSWLQVHLLLLCLGHLLCLGLLLNVSHSALLRDISV